LLGGKVFSSDNNQARWMGMHFGQQFVFLLCYLGSVQGKVEEPGMLSV